MSKKVALIDDDVAVRRHIRMLLEIDGFYVIEYEPSRLGLDAIDVDLVDVLVSDIVMPGYDGFDLLRDVYERRVDLPVVAYSKQFPMHADAAKVLGAHRAVGIISRADMHTVAEATRDVARRRSGRALPRSVVAPNRRTA